MQSAAFPRCDPLSVHNGWHRQRVRVFRAFAAGMGTFMISVSVLTAVTGRSYSLGRYVHQILTLGSLGFILIGGYVTWYTLTAVDIYNINTSYMNSVISLV